MPVETDAEVLSLRGVLRDLVALSSIPAAWVGNDPRAVAVGLADSLIALLRLDFAFVRLSDAGGAGAVDVIRGSPSPGFPQWLEAHLATKEPRKEVFSDPGNGSAPRRGVAIPVGVNGEGGVVAAASERDDFPTGMDELLLSLAANHAATAFQSARLIDERTRAEENLRQARNELEVKVAERTAELLRSEAYLLEAQRLTHTGSFAIDASSGEPTHSSDEHSRLYGFGREQKLRSLDEFVQRIHRDDRARCLKALEEGIRTERTFEVEYRVVLPEGPVKQLHTVAHPAFKPSGELHEFVGTVVDVTERQQAEEERQAQLWFFESLDSINRAIQRTSDLEQMLGTLLDVVLAVFEADRAWLIYPCDPEADAHHVRMERTQPDYIGAFDLGAEIPNGPEIAAVVRMLLASNGPVRFDPASPHAVPSVAAERYDVKSMIAMAVYPKTDRPYMFGLHQCSHPRIWTPAAERLFQEIGRRLADALDTLLMFRTLRESERNLERSRAELAASRARIVTAADETRRRIERDLHDGVQQRLVSLQLELGTIAAAMPAADKRRGDLAHAADSLAGALEDLAEISRGIHPATLADGGLGPALKTLARRSAVPVELELFTDTRLPARVEVAAYYIVSEAFTNTAKHASASVVHVSVDARDGVLDLCIRDDGRGGANATRGSGLIGLADRVDALEGTIDVESRLGEGTILRVTLPISGVPG